MRRGDSAFKELKIYRSLNKSYFFQLKFSFLDLNEMAMAAINQREKKAKAPYNYWNDKTFMAELNKRSAELKLGKVKGIKWEEVKAQIIARTSPQ